MTVLDLPLGLRLGRQAGWNQTGADWRRLFDLQPDGCFVAEWDGTPAGTTTTCICGQVGWVAMVLVDEAVRGRGLGTALLVRALEFLDGRGVHSIRLDATPMGRPLYQRLGFAEQYQLQRYEGTLPPGPEVAEVEEAAPGHWEALARLDQAVTGVNRRRLLFRLFGEQPGGVRLVREGGRPCGFLAWRPGDRAVQLGPWVASAGAGPLLLADACARHAGRRVFLDVPVPNGEATQLAEAWGLRGQRHLMRMSRGMPPGERRDWLWASSGPEKG
jgi:GNAT superfamily N-acetyltransferase